MTSLPIHKLRAPDVFASLSTRSQGLTQGEANNLLELYGPNTIPDPPTTSIWRRSFAALTYPMALLLWLGGFLALFTSQPQLAAMIWGVILVNAVFSLWQEHKAQQAVVMLNRMLPAFTRVLRDGVELSIPASQVVPGDILVLGQGDNISADARIVEHYGLRVNQAVLTGEATAAIKSVEPSLRNEISELEHPNLIFAGTSIVAGTGKAVVYATGVVTQFGRIARLSERVVEPPSTLQVELFRLSQIITGAAIVLGIIVFVVGTLDVGIPLAESFLLGVGVIVAVVPEGLRPTLTLSLAIAVQRLAGRGVLVKKLAMLETLGKISVVCTDKSGTLTQNQMTVREIWINSMRISVSGVGYEPAGGFTPQPASRKEMTAAFDFLLRAAYLCNNSRLIPPDERKPQWSALGDQTEAALRSMALKGGLDEEEATHSFPRIHELPFDAVRKRMTTIHRGENGNIAFVKGAPKEVLTCCTHILMDGTIKPLTETTLGQIVTSNDDFARRALRVMALAYRELPPGSGGFDPNTVEHDLVFIGLTAMMDPARPDVAHSMEVFKQAGIRMIMITGDYGLTGESLARRIGMLQTERPRIVTGSELDALSDEELIKIFDEEVIFARVAPEHKLRIVTALQTSGQTVAFSGDGVNDVPALRKADVGIAMGITGTDIAREAADIILTKDKFGDIAVAVEEGRAIYENIRKFLTYILASNIPEIVPFLLTALLDIPLALTVAQILTIDLGTDLLPALALGIERPEHEVMEMPPRPRSLRLVDSALLWRALWIGGLETLLCYCAFGLTYMLATPTTLGGIRVPVWLAQSLPAGLPSEALYSLATTVFFIGVVTAQIGSAITSRTERVGVRRLGFFSNPVLWVGLVCEVLLTMILVYVKPIADLFGNLPVPPGLLLILGSFAFIVYLLDRLRKTLLWRKPTLSENRR